ncbi:aminoacyl-tRNA hydrolase [Fulvivirga sp. M361]|uniref:alternative ribosome rescue aminoacyl-tRNA hydrolase ArfB n=1 Tax=Fulvivirga sp. M361 TaxID=2594266 RepID=UPI00117AF59E|nr:alternative ribosome rescue aminoacyl-tRNA hydrolase ArfB [Fulvivirga sp. M361]TRX58390.1 aminoacyl-tRNA hydrolase [Fulvivirga sp. M361]
MAKQRRKVSVSDIKAEVKVSTSRSGGPGGQHVNKVETKVQLSFDVGQSQLLTDLEKKIIKARHSSKITKEGVLIITADSKRSQLRNKELAFKKLDRLLSKAFTKKVVRKPTKPGKAAIEKRLKEKKLHAEKKKMRQKL